jgi:alkylhydroperoxidase family enzyme
VGERYDHLTLDERRLIFQLREAKMSVPRIAERLGRHRSTIHREIRRNWHDDGPWLRGYFPQAAQARTDRRRIRRRKLHQNSDLARYVIARLQQAWSPEQIAGERQAQILGAGPRLAPLKPDEVAEAALQNTISLRKAASRAADVAMADIPELVFTLLRHPELDQRIADLSIQLLGHGSLSARDRELVVLRVAWLWQAPYEWGEHVTLAKAAGITSQEIERITEGSAAAGWNEHEAALLRAAEELKADAMISDATWATLSLRLDDKQLFELPVLVGQFTNVAFFQNGLRLRLEAHNPGLHAR